MYDFAIVGGGVVGLATALALAERFVGAEIVVFEKEATWAAHQSGHNSGVLHSGLYYRPGSLKAQLCKAGNAALVAFCREHGIAHDICGKVIAATEARELADLEKLYRRGQENGLAVEKLDAEGVRRMEPHVRALAGLFVPTAGIVDYREVARRYAELIGERGGTLRLNCPVERLEVLAKGWTIETKTSGSFEARFLINCAGLWSDRLARLARSEPPARIVPFRGEYYELVREKRYLINNLVYPVPDPAFPFLGVHFTRLIDGSIHAGPNAVLSFKREGYQKGDFDRKDLQEVLGYGGFWKLAARHWRAGLAEQWRSWNKAAFVKSLQRLVPEVQSADLLPAGAGVRAQALRPDGGLVDDFLLVEGPRALHVCNAPSPAATASLAIGQAIAERVAALRLQHNSNAASM